MIPIRKSMLATIFGKAKGNAIKNLLWPNKAGKFSAGFAKNPPNDGPKIDPKDHTSGIMENARGCSSFSGTISATIVRMMPTANISIILSSTHNNVPFPLHPPARALAMTAIGSDVDMPQNRLDNIVIVNPTRIVGFRPNLSEARPQITAVVHCESEKAALVIPAHLATFFFSIPKLSIISGYGHVSMNRKGSRVGYLQGMERPKSMLPVLQICILLSAISIQVLEKPSNDDCESS